MKEELMETTLSKLLDMVSKWDYFGQALFFLIILSGLSTLVVALGNQLVILVRGYPPVPPVDDEEEIEDDHPIGD